MTTNLHQDEAEDFQVCECEPDWSCPLHANRAPWIDRRFQGTDRDEALAFGRPQDA